MELAAECCREILHHVNQAVRDMEDLLVCLAVAVGPRAMGCPCVGLGQALVLSISGPLLWRPGPALGLSPSGSLWVSHSLRVLPMTLPSPHPHRQRLKDYQKRLDLSHLRQSSDPMLSEFKVALPALPSPAFPCSPAALPLLPLEFSANAP